MCHTHATKALLAIQSHTKLGPYQDQSSPAAFGTICTGKAIVSGVLVRVADINQKQTKATTHHVNQCLYIEKQQLSDPHQLWYGGRKRQLQDSICLCQNLVPVCTKNSENPNTRIEFWTLHVLDIISFTLPQINANVSRSRYKPRMMRKSVIIPLSTAHAYAPDTTDAVAARAAARNPISSGTLIVTSSHGLHTWPTLYAL